jgi:hypothetical protein
VIDPTTRNPVGARITRLLPNTPVLAFGADAKKEYPEKGDVIHSIAFGSATPVIVKTSADITNALVLQFADTKVKITYRKKDKSLTWTGVLGKAP